MVWTTSGDILRDGNEPLISGLSFSFLDWFYILRQSKYLPHFALGLGELHRERSAASCYKSAAIPSCSVYGDPFGTGDTGDLQDKCQASREGQTPLANARPTTHGSAY